MRACGSKPLRDLDLHNTDRISPIYADTNFELASESLAAAGFTAIADVIAERVRFFHP